MSLKGIKLSTPEYDDKIPSTGQSVKLTPFRVGDEKTLLIAAQSEKNIEMVNALKSVIKNCVSGVDVDSVAPYDLEYLFVKLRTISVGESSKIGVNCKHCDVPNELKLDLTNISVSESKNKDNFVKIEDNLVFKMKYPKPEEIVNIDFDNPSEILELVSCTVDQVYHGDEVIDVEPGDRPDLVEMIESMTTKQFESLQQFFVNLPKLYKDIEFVCGACGKDNKQRLEGLASFF